MRKKVTIEVELGEHEFQCHSCKKIHKMSMYARAQTGMGHQIVFTCDCKRKTYLG